MFLVPMPVLKAQQMRVQGRLNLKKSSNTNAVFYRTSSLAKFKREIATQIDIFQNIETNGLNLAFLSSRVYTVV